MSSKSFVLSAQLKRDIKQWMNKFPKGKQASAVIMALRLVQDAHGYLQDAHIDAVADFLSMPTIQAYEVAKFYSMYRQSHQGKHVLKICRSVSCYLRDADSLIAAAKDKLNINLGETTPCGQFSLREVECLGACCEAPCMLVGDHQYHYEMTPEKLQDLLSSLQAEEAST